MRNGLIWGGMFGSALGQILLTFGDKTDTQTAHCALRTAHCALRTAQSVPHGRPHCALRTAQCEALGGHVWERFGADTLNIWGQNRHPDCALRTAHCALRSLSHQ